MSESWIYGAACGAFAVFFVYQGYKLLAAILADRKRNRDYEIKALAERAAWDIFCGIDARLKALEAKK